MKNKKINWKAFTSFNITFSFLFMTISGIILYFTPPGRVAYWSNWKLFALTKEGWQAVHTIFSLIFLIGAIFHLYFNWNVFTAYIKLKMQKGIRMKRELGWNTVIAVVVMVLTLANVPPFSTIMDWGEALSNSWSTEQSEPPVPHAELLTITEFAKTTQIPLETIMRNLHAAGMQADSSSMVINDLAEKYNLSPQQLYEKINVKASSGTSTIRSGGGYGRKTVQEICAENNISVETGLSRLEKQGIQAKAGDKVRDVAMANNLLPVDFVNIIVGTKLSGEEK